MSIKKVEDIVHLLMGGFKDWETLGDVDVKEWYGELVQFNYSHEAQYANRWNMFEQLSRGLIINKHSGEIVARPFDKFFNWMQDGRYSSGDIVSISEKMDGSLGILYRYNGEYRIATRGSLESHQAIRATRMLSKYPLSYVPDEYTLIFEIIYPENRIVVNYEDTEELFLLAARNRHTGAYVTENELWYIANLNGFLLPKKYENFSRVEDIIDTLVSLSHNEEGYVVEFSDGQRFKFKGDEYLKVHKIIYGLSFKNVLEMHRSTPDAIEKIRETIPDELLKDFEEWCDYINATYLNILNTTKEIFSKSPKTSRKEFALHVIKNYEPYSHILFAFYDKKNNIREIIFNVVEKMGIEKFKE